MSIEKFDVNQAAEKLKLKIRDAFVELLTPEQFKAMVAEELRRFTSTTRSTYDGNATPSGFEVVCREVFSDLVKTEIKQYLASPECSTQWNPELNRQGISAAVEAWLTKNRQELIETTIQTMAGSAAQSMLERIRNGY